jgi:hypothetical protein
MDNGQRSVGYCPHCGNKAPQKLLYTHLYSTGDDEENFVNVSFFLAAYETCNGALLYSETDEDFPPASSFTEAWLAWPTSHRLHYLVPAKIAAFYGKAARVRKIDADAFAVQIGKALEAICSDHGADKGTLDDRLKILASKNIIPPPLAEMTGVLRKLRNLAAHNSGEPVTSDQADTIDDFFKAVIEYVYVAPAKLKNYQDRLEADHLMKEHRLKLQPNTESNSNEN